MGSGRAEAVNLSDIQILLLSSCYSCVLSLCHTKSTHFIPIYFTFYLV